MMAGTEMRDSTTIVGVVIGAATGDVGRGGEHGIKTIAQNMEIDTEAITHDCWKLYY